MFDVYHCAEFSVWGVLVSMVAGLVLLSDSTGSFSLSCQRVEGLPGYGDLVGRPQTCF